MKIIIKKIFFFNVAIGIATQIVHFVYVGPRKQNWFMFCPSSEAQFYVTSLNLQQLNDLIATSDNNFSATA